MCIEERQIIFTSIIPDPETDVSAKMPSEYPYTIAIVLDNVKPGFIKSIYLLDPEGYEKIIHPTEKDLHFSVDDILDNTATRLLINSPVINNKGAPCKIVIYNAKNFNDAYSIKSMNDELNEGKLVYDSIYNTQIPYYFFKEAKMHYSSVEMKETDFSLNEGIYVHYCLHAKFTVRCLLMGYILHNHYKLKLKTRNLIKLWEIAVSINESFDAIKKECEILTRYTEILGYSSSYLVITEKDVADAVKAAQTVYNFPPFVELREIFMAMKG